ncbi:DUF3973 domain-containing protein [Ammoniphilus sp. 3BR4]|uniref:DUF3973 domain-containing protein n=1 Tax=Ammoniphilus sp. 3BR4 TaxID=3158265 RepID=UPI0034666BD9
MYYCLHCKQIHKCTGKKETIFQSGYTLVEDKKIPLGMCQKEKELVQRASFQFSY